VRLSERAPDAGRGISPDAPKNPARKGTDRVVLTEARVRRHMTNRALRPWQANLSDPLAILVGGAVSRPGSANADAEAPAEREVQAASPHRTLEFASAQRRSIANGFDHGDRPRALHLDRGAPLSFVPAACSRSLRCASSQLRSKAASNGCGLLQVLFSSSL
jgi:hypothetical protein